jgi:hypothetical protein
MDNIVSIWKNTISAITTTRLIKTAITIIGLLYAAMIWSSGMVPVIYRLGKSLANGKIAIFSNTEYSSLANMLVESKLFKQRNILHVSNNEIEKAKSANVLLVHWSEFKSTLDRILQIKDDDTALIIYAPQKEGFLDQDTVDKLNSYRNTIIVNMRGRLLNDILVASITSNYGK